MLLDFDLWNAGPFGTFVSFPLPGATDFTTFVLFTSCGHTPRNLIVTPFQQVRNIFQSIVFLALLFSCTSTDKKKGMGEFSENQSIQGDTSSIDVFINTAQADESVDQEHEGDESRIIDYVKKTTKLRSDTLVFEEAFRYDKSFHLLPKDYRDQLNGVTVQNSQIEKLVVNDYDRYNLIDYFEDSDFFYYRVLIDDEYCCRSLYAVTLNKSDKRIHNISFLGLKGGDGGWAEFDTEYWKTDTTILYIKLSTYDEDIYEDGYRRTTDSLIVKYSIVDGKFQKSLLDSVRYERKITTNQD